MKNNEQIKREYKTVMNKIKRELNSAFIMLLVAMAVMCAASAVSGAEVFDAGAESLADSLLTCTIFAAAAFVAKVVGTYFVGVKLRTYFYEKSESVRCERFPNSAIHTTQSKASYLSCDRRLSA